jgi:predicted phosphodiesterase
MLRVALLADIHANLPALEAVLADMPEVDHICCLGDMVGYYTDANAVCARVRALGATVIRGNHDAYVIGALEPAPDREAAYRTTLTRQMLEPSHLRWLRGLPTTAELRCGSTTLTLRHANPWDEERYLYPDSPLLDDLRLQPGEILAVGHTHRPMAKRIGGGLLVNPGSVGQPRDWKPLASYALMELPRGSVSVRRVAYDVPAYQRGLAAQGLAQSSIDILSRTR